MALFLRLTIVIAAVIAGLFLLALALKVVVAAAILAAIATGAYFVYSALRRKPALQSQHKPLR